MTCMFQVMLWGMGVRHDAECGLMGRRDADGMCVMAPLM
jgi:hypothetical protein